MLQLRIGRKGEKSTEPFENSGQSTEGEKNDAIQAEPQDQKGNFFRNAKPRVLHPNRGNVNSFFKSLYEKLNFQHAFTDSNSEVIREK